MREQHERAQHRCLNGGRHHVENDRGEWSVVPGVEEICRQDERPEPAEIVHQEQRGAHRRAQHEPRTRREHAATAPPLLQSVRHPAPDERTQHTTGERPQPKLRAHPRNRQPVHPLHECRCPRDQPVHRERDHRAAQKYPDQRRRTQHEYGRILKVVERTRGDGSGVTGAPHGERHQPPHRPGDPDARADAEHRRAELRRNSLE